MSRHLNAPHDAIAPLVLISGNPARTRWAAEKFLTAPKLVSDNRGALIYTGTYQNLRVSFATSGMGMGSIRIYAHELFRDYHVKIIIRIGTAGGYQENVRLFDLFNPATAHSEISDDVVHSHLSLSAQPHAQLFTALNQTANQMGLPVKTGKVHSTDFFYAPHHVVSRAHQAQCEIVEMESQALWRVARQHNRQAASLLLVTDLLHSASTVRESTFAERIHRTEILFRLALTTLQNYS